MDFAMKTPSGMLDPDKLRFPTLVQPKLDGLRGVVVVRGGVHSWYSYSGKPLWNLENVSRHMAPWAAGMYDGEIIWPGHPFADAYGLCKRQKPDPKKYPDHEKDKLELQYHVFDHLTIDQWDQKKCYLTFRNRLHALQMESWSHSHPVVQTMGVDRIDSLDEFHRMHDIYLGMGHEGTMVKDPEGLYHWKRHPDWHRWKPTLTEDFRITGAVEGKGKWKGALGAFLLDLGLPKPQEAGGGRIDLATRTDWWRRRSELIGAYVEVTFKCRTPDGYLREPILIRLREDKR